MAFMVQREEAVLSHLNLWLVTGRPCAATVTDERSAAPFTLVVVFVVLISMMADTFVKAQPAQVIVTAIGNAVQEFLALRARVIIHLEVSVSSDRIDCVEQYAGDGYVDVTLPICPLLTDGHCVSRLPIACPPETTILIFQELRLPIRVSTTRMQGGF